MPRTCSNITGELSIHSFTEQERSGHREMLRWKREKRDIEIKESAIAIIHIQLHYIPHSIHIQIVLYIYICIHCACLCLYYGYGKNRFKTPRDTKYKMPKTKQPNEPTARLLHIRNCVNV